MKTTNNLVWPAFALFAFACLALSPAVEAVSPPPDGGYANFNTAEGQNALLSLDTTTGANNTAVGFASLGFLITGNLNTGVGTATLLFDTADRNTAIGAGALLNNSIGSSNTANGAFALSGNTTGFANVAIGDAAMLSSDSNFNTVVGFAAGQNLIGGTENIYVGDTAGTVEAGDESGTIRIGSLFAGNTACFIHGISGVTGANFTDLVLLDPITGQLGDLSSSAQYKKDIASMDKASEAIFSLKPVTFHYKNDQTDTPQFGLIAEEVAKVNPALVGVDKEGKPHSVQYMKVDAMLLNEFLKEHKKVEKQEASIAELKSTVGVLTAQLKEQAAQIQKVSAQLEVNNPAPQVAKNP